jgi:septal ring factor EnvC (AmiA/AmiB activator)
MRHPQIHFTVGILIVGVLLAIPTTAQETAQERAANLRTQLTETQEKQAELQLRLQQLEEDLKPENIERSFAGIGSTHPEELREARRRQLEIQKRGVQTQLETLAAGRTRLEAAIARADTEAYQQSARPGLNTAEVRTNNAVTATKKVQRPRKHRPKKRRS